MDEVFTTDASETPVSVASWGFLGDTWPFFRPNFVNMEKHMEERRAEEVRMCKLGLIVLRAHILAVAYCAFAAETCCCAAMPGQTMKSTSSEESHKQKNMLCVQVVGFVPTGWMYEMKRTGFPVRKKSSCQVLLIDVSPHTLHFAALKHGRPSQRSHCSI